VGGVTVFTFFVYSFIHSFILSFFLFIHSFILSFDSVIHSFIQSPGLHLTFWAVFTFGTVMQLITSGIIK
jgi:hypothetical protein